MNEQGVKGYEYFSWVGLFLHKDAPNDAVQLLRKECDAISADRSFQVQLIRSGLDPWYQSAEQLAKIVNADYAKWQRVIPEANIKGE